MHAIVVYFYAHAICLELFFMCSKIKADNGTVNGRRHYARIHIGGLQGIQVKYDQVGNFLPCHSDDPERAQPPQRNDSPVLTICVGGVCKTLDEDQTRLAKISLTVAGCFICYWLETKVPGYCDTIPNNSIVMHPSAVKLRRLLLEQTNVHGACALLTGQLRPRNHIETWLNVNERPDDITLAMGSRRLSTSLTPQGNTMEALIATSKRSESKLME